MALVTAQKYSACAGILYGIGSVALTKTVVAGGSSGKTSRNDDVKGVKALSKSSGRKVMGVAQRRLPDGAGGIYRIRRRHNQYSVGSCWRTLLNSKASRFVFAPGAAAYFRNEEMRRGIEF